MSLTGLETVSASMDTSSLPVDETREVHVLCPSGKIPLSGGWANSSTPSIVVARSEPRANLDGWQITVVNRGASSVNPTVTVRCLCADS